MEMTTIAIDKNLREKVKEFGAKGETYSDIIAKLVESARQRQLHDLLMSDENTITIEEARERLNKKWPR